MFLNPQFIFLALAILPEIMGAISETVQAVSVNMSEASPDEKAAAAEKAVLEWYDAADENLKFSDSIDKAFKEDFLPGFIKLLYKGMKHTEPEQILMPEDLPHG